MAATRHEAHHHPVAGPEVAHGAADGFDCACRLMAERHRHGPWPVAVDDGKVGMAEACSADAHQQFIRAWRIEVDSLNGKRPRHGIGPFDRRVPEHRCTCFQTILPLANGGSLAAGDRRRQGQIARLAIAAADRQADGTAVKLVAGVRCTLGQHAEDVRRKRAPALDAEGVLGDAQEHDFDLAKNGARAGADREDRQ